MIKLGKTIPKTLHISEVIYLKNGKTIPIIDENKRNSGNTRKTDFPKMRERLEKLRKENGYTQEQVAKKITCCPRAYRSWVTGKYDAKTNTQQYAVPSLENLMNLSALYNVSIDYITGNSDYTKIGNKEMSQKTGLSNDSIDALHMLHAPIDPSATDSQQTGRYDIIALNLILEDFYNNAKNTEDYQKYSRLTDTLLNQIGRYIDSNSSNFGTTTPIFRQNENTFVFSQGEVAEEIFKTQIYESLKQLKEKYSLDIIFKRKENLKYFDKCFKSYVNDLNAEKR